MNDELGSFVSSMSLTMEATVCSIWAMACIMNEFEDDLERPLEK